MEAIDDHCYKALDKGSGRDWIKTVDGSTAWLVREQPRHGIYRAVLQ